MRVRVRVSVCDTKRSASNNDVLSMHLYIIIK